MGAPNTNSIPVGILGLKADASVAPRKARRTSEKIGAPQEKKEYLCNTRRAESSTGKANETPEKAVGPNMDLSFGEELPP